MSVPQKSKSAFSLVELLVAIAVAVVVGGAVMSAILYSFGTWEHGLASAGSVRAADDFDLDFSRDFASACSGLGFDGNDKGCAFWTFRPSADGLLRLTKVRYSLGRGAITAEEWTTDDDPEQPGAAHVYKTAAFSAFAYNGTNMSPEEFSAVWQCESNMPSVISMPCVLNPSAKGQRVYLRRTE